MVFDLDAVMLPAAYPFVLWAALIQRVPDLAQENQVGVLPLRGAMNSEGILLPRRAKLTMRLPVTLAQQTAARLTGQALDIAGKKLHFGAAKMRAIQPYPTVHAQLVADDRDEIVFMEHVNARLNEMQVKGKLICGRHRTMNGGQQPIQGYSLVIHDLKAEASLRLQYAGMGEHRQFGCGIFVPYKVISGLGDD